MGDSILSSLSAVPPSRVKKSTEQSNLSDPLQGLNDDTHTMSFVDDVAVEIITVTDYADVELGTSTDMEVVMGETCCEGTDGSAVTEDLLVVLPDETTREEEVDTGEEARQENAASSLTNLIPPEAHKDDLAPSQHKTSVGPHDCPDCEKKFKFASSLIAHRVIHTGERPHRCIDCGRCFSFRQSLDRHRHMHKTGRKYSCVTCGETFHSLSARTEHKKSHITDVVYTCHQCNKKFNWKLGLARHMKTHKNDHKANKLTESRQDGREAAVCGASISKAPVAFAEPDSQLPTGDNADGKPGNAEIQSSKCPTSEPEVKAPEPNRVTSPMKVRTSGRKRKPTMKIQVINLQKRMITRRRKEITKTSPPELKPLPFNW